MKKLIAFFICYLATNTLSAQTNNDTTVKILTPTIVDASCGQCQFHLKTQKGCDLAVKINGTAYFVDGTKIDDHGDAHASEGFCNAIRKAEVKGAVINNRFVATSFKLLPDTKKKKKSKG